MAKSKNALAHGVYASDIVLPWEREDDFLELAHEICVQFDARSGLERELAREIAVLQWRKRRVARMTTVEILDSDAGAMLEKEGKRSARGIRASLRKSRKLRLEQRQERAAAEAALAGAIDSLVSLLQEKNANLGKAGANIRGMLPDIVGLRDRLAAPRDEREAASRSSIIEIGEKSCALEARLDSLIKRKVQQLVILKEFSRQYGGHGKLVTQQSINDDNSLDAHANGDDNFQDGGQDLIEYDWPHEYDEALADKKRRKSS